jgi:hypothetical protein
MKKLVVINDMGIFEDIDLYHVTIYLRMSIFLILGLVSLKVYLSFGGAIDFWVNVFFFSSYIIYASFSWGLWLLIIIVYFLFAFDNICIILS